jgi:small subunit ribosomal protein S16
VAVKIKLMRLGKMRAPYYRIVVADSRTKRDGRAIEEIGKYHPKQDPSFIEVNSERAAYWLGVGAQPTEAVTAIFKVSGDWQQFKGLPAPPPMKVAAPKADKRVAFEAAAKEGLGEPTTDATTPKKRTAPAKKAAEAPAEAPAAAAAAPIEAVASAEVAALAEVAAPAEAVSPAEAAEAAVADAIESVTATESGDVAETKPAEPAAGDGAADAPAES